MLCVLFLTVEPDEQLCLGTDNRRFSPVVVDTSLRFCSNGTLLHNDSSFYIYYTVYHGLDIAPWSELSHNCHTHYVLLIFPFGSFLCFLSFVKFAAFILRLIHATAFYLIYITCFVAKELHLLSR